MHRLISVPVLATALAGAALLGGCGDSTGVDQADDTSASPSASAAESPSESTTSSSASTATSSATASAAPALASCDSVWVDGQVLSFPYRGCVDGARTITAQTQPCEIGKPLVTFRNSFWATPGGPVHQVSGSLAEDAGWHRALLQCGG